MAAGQQKLRRMDQPAAREARVISAAGWQVPAHRCSVATAVVGIHARVNELLFCHHKNAYALMTETLPGCSARLALVVAAASKTLRVLPRPAVISIPASEPAATWTEVIP